LQRKNCKGRIANEELPRKNCKGRIAKEELQMALKYFNGLGNT
jgi:hypothetical protein